MERDEYRKQQEQTSVEEAHTRLKRRFTDLYDSLGVQNVLNDVLKFDWKTGEIEFIDKVEQTLTGGISENKNYRYHFGYALKSEARQLSASMALTSNVAIHPFDLNATLNQLMMVQFTSYGTGEYTMTHNWPTRRGNFTNLQKEMRLFTKKDKVSRIENKIYPFD